MMFKTLKKFFSPSPWETKGIMSKEDYDDRIAERDQQKKIDEAKAKQDKIDEGNFTEEDGVSCLFNKVLDSMDKSFDKWEYDTHWYDFIYENKSDEVSFRIQKSYSYAIGVNIKRGYLSISNAQFSINHDSCEKVEEAFVRNTNKERDANKDKVLKEWGCK